MRTHALPATAPTANGSAASSNASAAYAHHATRGSRFRFCQRPMRSSMKLCSIRNAFAEQARGPENQHQDQHEEREHILVIAAEDAAGQIADVAGTEAFDHTKQYAAKHRAAQVADAAEHRRGECLESEQKSHIVVRDAVIRANHHAG